MTAVRWNMPQDVSEAHQTQIFSGGACNILDGKGKLMRNKERDEINDWLTDKGLVIFDPQIHPDTHGCEYDYAVHSKLEKEARLAATINMYEVSPRTFGGITSFEIAADRFQFEEPTVIYYSDGSEHQDVIPAHDKAGHPLFIPYGVIDNLDAKKAHYREFIKNANNMRKYIMSFAQQMDALTVTFGDRGYDGDIVITPERMHGADMFKAVVSAASGRRTILNFTGGAEAQDEQGNPKLVVPDEPPIVQMDAFLDQYADEGNELRRAIAELVDISVFVRVVYTQASVLQALEEVLTIRGLI